MSNTGQDNSGARTVGSFDFAAVFGTGSNTAGYDLDSIVLSLGNAPTGTGTLTLTVREDASGDPSGTVLYTLTNPGTVQGNSLNTFAAPADATLDADSTYWVVMSYSDNSGGPNWWRMNLSDGIDSGGATGWTIDTPYKVDSRTSPDGWSVQSSSRGMKLQVKGTVIGGTLSTDATLSALALQDASDNSAITLSPTFVSGTTSYTASEANDVDEITVLPTVNESNATYEIQDGDGTALVDASSATGFQVALSEGENTVKVEVTAEDTTTTETYTVVVTRLRRVTTTPAAPPEIAVPNDWSLIPTGRSAGDKFRLLFLSSMKTNGESYDIADYNTFIQGLVAVGHTDIQTYSSGFRAVGCTPDSDATANTATTGSGVRIYWLNGAKAADNYGDFYNGNWDEEAADKNESGTNGPDTSNSSNYPLTGCDDDGTEDVDGGTSYALGESQVRVARPDSSAGNAGPLTSNSDTAKANTRPMYGLSQVFEVAVAGNTPASGAPAITGAAQVGKVLTAGLGTIADAEDLPGTFPDDYTFQWVRVNADGSNPVNKGTDSSTYTVVVGDVGKKIFVEVSFTDGGGTAEGPLTSAAYPSNAPVAAAAGACPADNDWCTTLTVGLNETKVFNTVTFSTYGYSDPGRPSIPDGDLDEPTIDYGGTSWSVLFMQIVDAHISGDDAVEIALDAHVPLGSVFDLGGTTFTADAAARRPTGQYSWAVPAGFAWVHGQDVTVSVKLGSTTPSCDGVWCATLTVKALDGGNHFGCANSQSGKACSNSSTLTEDEFIHASTDYDVTSVQVRSNGQVQFWMTPDIATGSESLVLHIGSETFPFQSAHTKQSNNRRWNNTGLSWSAGEAVALKLTEAVAAEVILPAPRLPSVDDPNAIWMATLTVADLGSNQYGYDGSQGGLTDTAFTYLGDDTPLSGGTYQEVGTLYTIDELFYDTDTGQLLFSLDGAFVDVNADAANNIFVDVGGERKSFSDGAHSAGTYTFTFPDPSWTGGEEVTVKIVVLKETNGPVDLAATTEESDDQFDVTLTWTAPMEAVTGYRVEHQPDPALQWRTLESSQTGTTYADSGLGRGTVRYYRVAALRSGGASYSEIVRVQAEPETTEVPEKVNFVDVKPAAGSNRALEVAWNRPRTPLSRAPATGYHVQYAQHDGAAPAWRDGEDWATVTFPRWMERLPWRTWSGVVEAIEFEESTERSASLKTVVTGLKSGTNYRVRVRGCTEAGCGDWSYPRRWTTSGATLNATEGQPLTATLEDFPVNHDGSSAFTFRIAFSAEVVISRQDMKEHALTVVGGTVTRARRVDRRKDLWELTVEPAGTGAVSVLVPLGRACTETGALCTADGQMLTTGLGHSVPGPAPVAQGQQALDAARGGLRVGAGRA